MSTLIELLIRGLRSAQPLATDVAAGSLYFVTDEGVTEQSDGTNWNSYSGSGGAISAVNFSAGTTSHDLAAVVFSNSNGVSFGLNGSTITGSHNGLTSQSNQAFSAEGGSSTFQTLNFTNSNGFSFSNTGGSIWGSFSTLVFGNSNGVSFGVNAGTLTATVKTDYQSTGAYLTTAMLSNAVTLSNINISAGTTSNNLSALVFSNSNGVSFGLNGSTVTASAAAAGVSAINVSAGTTSNNLTNLIFSNSNGVSFGLDGSTITASASGGGGAAPTFSYFENLPFIPSANLNSFNRSSIFIQPFMLPFNLSGGYFRSQASYSLANGPATATSANSTFTLDNRYTHALVFYSQGTGASSLSLMSMFSTSAGSTYQTIVGNGTAGSQFSVTVNISYFIKGVSSTFSSTYAASTSAYTFLSSAAVNFAGRNFYDLPFNTSLSQGRYFVGMGHSSSFVGTGGPAGSTALSGAISGMYVGQSGMTLGNPGVGTAASILLQPGQGMFSTNSAMFSFSNNINMANLNTLSHMLAFEMIREG